MLIADGRATQIAAQYGASLAVVVAVPPELTRLARAIRGVAAVPDGDAPVPQRDFHFVQ
jgi:hypothetical protein